MITIVKITAAAFASVLVCLGSARSVTLSESPVREAMRASIAAAGVSDNFFANAPTDEFAAEPKETLSGRKSVFKAAVLSALVPGGGQYYLGERKKARYFFAAEALTWVSYLSFQTYGDWRRDDYIQYAATHANAQLEGKSDEFVTWVGFYNNIREFNSLGRAFDNARPYLEDTPDNHWEWQSADERRTFRDLRNRSRESYRRSDFMIGVAIVDRVISIIDAVRSTGRMNRRLGDGSFSLAGGAVRFSLAPLAPTRQLCLSFHPGF
jgi:hypothetical protein